MTGVVRWSRNHHPLIDIEIWISCNQWLTQAPWQRIPNPCKLAVRKRHSVGIPCMGPPSTIHQCLFDASTGEKAQMCSIQQTFVRVVKQPMAQRSDDSCISHIGERNDQSSRGFHQINQCPQHPIRLVQVLKYITCQHCIESLRPKLLYPIGTVQIGGDCVHAH